MQSLAFGQRPAEFLVRAARRYGDTFTVRIIHEGTWVVVSDPDSIRAVLTADPEIARAGEGNAFLGPLLGRESVILLDGAAHLARRRLLMPTLRGERLDAYLEMIRSVTAETAAAWRPGTRVRLASEMRAITLEKIIRAVFGIADERTLATARRRMRTLLWATTTPAAMGLIAVLGYRLTAHHPALHAVRAPVMSLLGEEVRRRRTAPDLHERTDLMSLLLRDTDLSDEQICGELLTLLVAGHETSATALTWAADCLLRHPEAARRAADDDEYLRAAATESLRLHPVVPLVARRLAAPLRVGAHDLPAGVTAVPCALLLHRRPDLYPEPSRFRPERFLGRSPGTYEWLPFGGGTRRCLGAPLAQLEMETVLRVLLRSTSLITTRRSPERIRRRAHTLAPRSGVPVLVRESA